jgi:DNA polymerase III subunit epsilon
MPDPSKALQAEAETAMPKPIDAQWDRPLAETPFVFVDLELTGLNPKHDHIIEVCAVRVLGNREEIYSTLVKPPDSAFAFGGSTHVHGITLDSLKDAPSFERVCVELRKLLDGAILVAHGARTDVTFLEAESLGLESPLKVPFFLDTLTLCRRSFHLESYSLLAIAKHFGLEPGKAHRAEQDVVLLRGIWPRILEKLEPKTARDLWEVRVSERKARTEILEACERARSSKSPVRITYRPSRKPAQEFGFMVTEVSADPPHVQGYFWPGRGRRDLRADRILRVDPMLKEPA